MKLFKALLLVGLSFHASLFLKVYQAHGLADKKFKTARDVKALFQKVGCKYLNDMEILYSQFDQINPYETEYYKSNAVLIDQHSKQYHASVKFWKLAPMYLKWISPVVGYGIFALKKMKAGDFIGVYAGQLREIDATSPKEDVDYAWYYPINALSGKRLLIDGKHKGNELRFINHDNNPNTKCMDVIVDDVFYMIYVATRDIEQDEELTVSYGDSYWSSRNIVPS